ncbi:MAG: rhodanese-like domain-containing protein [Parahaliea sp.]
MNNLLRLSFVTVLLALLPVLSSAQAIPANAVWIDVRTADEYASGYLPGAHHIPYDEIVSGVAELKLSHDTPIYLYCRSGRRAERARESLAAEGYSSLTNAGSLEEARKLSSTTP